MASLGLKQNKFQPGLGYQVEKNALPFAARREAQGLVTGGRGRGHWDSVTGVAAAAVGDKEKRKQEGENEEEEGEVALAADPASNGTSSRVNGVCVFVFVLKGLLSFLFFSP